MWLEYNATEGRHKLGLSWIRTRARVSEELMFNRVIRMAAGALQLASIGHSSK